MFWSKSVHHRALLINVINTNVTELKKLGHLSKGMKMKKVGKKIKTAHGGGVTH